MRLSLVMIARDEAHNVPLCFASFWDHVDEVVMVDTGSRDGTIGQARRFARERGEPGKLIVGRFKWCNDFAAARNHAHSLATGEVHCTMDLDDRLVGGENLREAAERLVTRPELGCVIALWSGPLTPGQWRPRLLRPPVRWVGMTWEEPIFDGPSNVASAVRWEHTRACSRGRRDLDLALRWAEKDPTASRPLLAAANEGCHCHEWETVEECCARGLSLPDLEAETRAAFCVRWAQARLAHWHDLTRAETLARTAIDLLPWIQPVWTVAGVEGTGELDLNGTAWDAWRLCAEVALRRGQFREALRCAVESAKIAATDDRYAQSERVGRRASAELARRPVGPWLDLCPV